MRVLPIRRLATAVSSLFLVTFASCLTSRWYEHRFAPAPLEAEVTTQAVAGAQVRALVTVIGIERGRKGARDRVIVRMRLENIGSAPAKLVADSLSLVSADLKPLGPASVEPAEVKEVEPGGDSTVDCAFTFLNGQGPYDIDLSGVNLRFTVTFGDQKVTTGMTFQRVDWRYLEPGYPSMHVGVGVGWSHFH